MIETSIIDKFFVVAFSPKNLSPIEKNIPLKKVFKPSGEWRASPPEGDFALEKSNFLQNVTNLG